MIENKNQAEILRINATDLDDGLNAKIRYFIENLKEIWNKFYLDPISGILTLNKNQSLDAEERKNYLIKVKARDSGEFFQLESESLEIFVEIEDVNDNSPIIQNSDQLDIFISNNAKIG